MPNSQVPVLPWMRLVLKAAGVYNLVWGAFILIFPNALFQLAGLEPLRYPMVWQSVGMIVGVYGLGYWWAARDPYIHWPVIMVGFLGKLFGPFGMVFYILRGDLPWVAGLVNVTNDLIWLAPFASILWHAFRYHNSKAVIDNGMPFPEALKVYKVQPSQESLFDASFRTPVMVVFLRHFGCTFCRETTKAVARRRRQVEGKGTRIVLVHMSAEGDAKAFLEAYGLADIETIQDPDCTLYHQFGLQKGSFRQLMGPRVLLRGLHLGIFKGNGIGPLQGDSFQMPGIFLLDKGQVVKGYRHSFASDSPDFMDLATCPA